MLQIKYIRENLDKIRVGLQKRNWSDADSSIINQILDVDTKRREAQQHLDEVRAKSNQISGQIGKLFQQGEREKAEELKAQVGDLKEDTKRFQEDFNRHGNELGELLLNVPNIPHDSVPFGSKEEDNEVYRAWEGSLPDLTESAVPHWDLAERYDILSFDLGVKITGSGFPLFKGKGARLERALISFFLDRATENGYLEVIPPLLVNEDSARGTGQLPDKEGQMYHATEDQLYLIPTAEVPITNIYRGDIIPEKNLPIKMAGYTPCFRREAGSYGKDVRGLNRVHQFDKVEIVRIEHPSKSYAALEQMLVHVSKLLDSLELPYRILRLCGGDLGFTSALTFDFEVYAAAQKKWLEVSSVSNFENYQSNRMKMRFRDEDNKIHLVHTLNGSALALARIVAALLENNQTEKGIIIPEVLRKYTGFDIID